MRLCAFVIAAACLAVFGAEARNIRTGPGRLVRDVAADRVSESAGRGGYDTIVPRREREVILRGYDKPNAAVRESFFAVNNTADSLTLGGMEIELTYIAMDGRMLHRVTRWVPCDIPPGQTRSLSIPTWDINHAFHYYLTPAPKRKPSEPYRVKSRLLRLRVGRTEYTDSI